MCLDHTKVWQGLLSHRAASVPSTLILLSLPLLQGSVSSPSAHLAWLTKRICLGITVSHSYVLSSKESLQRQFQCSCSSTCLWTERATSCSVMSCAMTLTLCLDADLQSNPESHTEVLTNLWASNDCEYFLTSWIVLSLLSLLKFTLDHQHSFNFE